MTRMEVMSWEVSKRCYQINVEKCRYYYYFGDEKGEMPERCRDK